MTDATKHPTLAAFDGDKRQPNDSVNACKATPSGQCTNPDCVRDNTDYGDSFEVWPSKNHSAVDAEDCTLGDLLADMRTLLDAAKSYTEPQSPLIERLPGSNDAATTLDSDYEQTQNSDRLQNGILASRAGGFGSSDAKMIYNIGLRGSLTAGDKDRIAAYLGLKRRGNKGTEATENGHRREQQIFDMQRQQRLEHDATGIDFQDTVFWRDANYTWIVSNPCIENAELTRQSGIRCFTHIDIAGGHLVDGRGEREWEIYWIEVKTSRDCTGKVWADYNYQLLWHWWALENYEPPCNDDHLDASYRELYLLHYKEDDIGGKFDESKIQSILIEPEEAELANFKTTILAGLKVIADSLEAVRTGFSERGEQYLAKQDFPEEVAAKCEQLADFLLQKKKFDEIETQLKDNLRIMMQQKNWKKCGTPWFAVRLNADSTRSTVDTDKLKAKYPDIYAECLKTTAIKGKMNLELSKSYLKLKSNDTGLEDDEAALEVENV